MIGLQIQLNMEVPTHYCGYLTTRGVRLPPPPSKFTGFAKFSSKCGVGRKVGKGWVPLLPDQLHMLDHTIPATPRLMLCWFAVSGCTPIVTAICQYNIAKAIFGRLFRAPRNQPQPAAFANLARLRSLLFTPATVEPWTVEDWISSLPGRRQRALREAASRLRRTGWLEEYERFHVFTKSEKLFGCVKKDGHLEPATELMDRLIQAPADEAHVVAGPRLKPVVGLVKTVWCYRNCIFYASVSPDVLQKWTTRVRPRGRTGVCVDYSMFDATHSRLSWDLIEKIYEECGVVDESLRDLLRQWRCPRGYATGVGWALRYLARALNASGRDDTALVNALLNGLVIFVALCAAYFGVPVEQLTEAHVAEGMQRFDVAIVGDDSLAYIPPIEPTRFPAFSAALSAAIGSFGLDADKDKIVITNDVNQQVFLGMRLYDVGEELVWGRTIGRCLFKAGYKCSPMPPDPGAWAAGEARALLVGQRHVPVISDLAEAYLSWWGGGPVTPVPDDPDKPWKQVCPRPMYDLSTMLCVCRVYSTTLAELDSLLDLIRSINRFPCVLNHPLLTRFVLHDEA